VRKFQRRILVMIWKDEVRNEVIGAQTKHRLYHNGKKTEMSPAGHLLRMDDDRLPRQAMQWESETAKRKPGIPRNNWNETV